jgi:hypothetical protein
MHGTTLGTSVSNAHAVSGGAGTSKAFSTLITRIYPVLDRASATSELTVAPHALRGREEVASVGPTLPSPARRSCGRL